MQIVSQHLDPVRFLASEVHFFCFPIVTTTGNMKAVFVLSLLLGCTGFSSAAISITANSFTISPSNSKFTLVDPTTVTFAVTLENDDTTAGGTDVTDLALYLSDNADFTNTDKEVKVADKDSGLSGITFALNVPNNDGSDNGELAIADKTASVTIPSLTNCADFTKICLQVTPDDAIICTGSAANFDCSLITVKANTFSITGPSDYSLTETEATSITFGLTLSNAGTATEVTDVQLYLSDNEDFSATEKEVQVADKSSGITGITFGVAVSAESGGTAGEEAISNAVGSVTLPSTNCADLDLLCVLVEPHGDVQCNDIADKKECSDDGTTPETTTAGTGIPSVHVVALMISSLVVFLERIIS